MTDGGLCFVALTFSPAVQQTRGRASGKRPENSLRVPSLGLHPRCANYWGDNARDARCFVRTDLPLDQQTSYVTDDLLNRTTWYQRIPELYGKDEYLPDMQLKVGRRVAVLRTQAAAVLTGGSISNHGVVLTCTTTLVGSGY